MFFISFLFFSQLLHLNRTVFTLSEFTVAHNSHWSECLNEMRKNGITATQFAETRYLNGFPINNKQYIRRS